MGVRSRFSAPISPRVSAQHACLLDGCTHFSWVSASNRMHQTSLPRPTPEWARGRAARALASCTNAVGDPFGSFPEIPGTNRFGFGRVFRLNKHGTPEMACCISSRRAVAKDELMTFFRLHPTCGCSWPPEPRKSQYPALSSRVL